MPRTGRRPGTGATREVILLAARQHFADAGYEHTTLRDVAALAGVDARLILHYFGSKEGLFRAAVAFPIDAGEAIPRLLQPGLDGLGTRLASLYLDTLEPPSGSATLALIRSAVSSETAAALVREAVSREIIARVAQALRLDQPELRASLAASQLVGMAIARYVVRLEPLASAPRAAVVDWLGPTLQRYLTDPAATATPTPSPGLHPAPG